MKLKKLPYVLLALMLLAPMLPAHVAGAQGDYPLENCVRGGFSTEEDFMMIEGEPYDGNPYISDGDVLSFDGQVCARNRDLLLPSFDVNDDLGLDALDILRIDTRGRRHVIAFSTELDSPHGTFTAGDLLFTTGGIIPNAALVLPFQIPYDIGLDGVHFIGSEDRLLRLVEFVRNRDPEDPEWTQGLLQGILKELEIDIWFSIEGTWPFSEDRPILDGDVLSARDGIVVLAQWQLLDPLIPAGIPDRGVDFGLDGLTGSREPDRESVVFSTEILYRGRESSFTDGDVLRVGGSVVTTNESLVKPFSPAADFLGLDALSIPLREPVFDPNIQTMCGDGRYINDFEGGVAPIGVLNPAFTGLYRPPLNPPLRQPCGRYVPIDGFMPDDVIRFRVAYREVNEPVPANVGDAPAIETRWRLAVWDPILAICKHDYGAPTFLETDPDGWIEAINYLEAKTGLDVNGDSIHFTDGCVNSGLRLAVWNTLSLPAGSLPGHDREDHYVVWLEWEDSTGFHREPVDHHLQLDNTLPEIAPWPAGLEVRLTDGTTVVPACGEAPEGSSEFQVWAQFDDAYYWNFQLIVRGGVPPASTSYGPHNYYDPDDGPPGLKNTDDTGTVPDATTVHVRNIDMTDLGASFVDCCYILELYVRDASIRHSFNGFAANDASGSFYSYTFITFAASP